MSIATEEGGIIGVCTRHTESAQTLLLGLNAIQHRGQNSVGIACSKNNAIEYLKQDSLVNDLLEKVITEDLQTEACLGYVGDQPFSLSNKRNVQPFQITYRQGSLAVVMHGGLTNREEIRQELSHAGAVFTSNSDAETIAYSIAHQHTHNSLIDAIRLTMEKLKGGYTFAVLEQNRIIAVRDPLSIRPFCIGKLKYGYAIASESCAISLMGGELISDIKSGELIEITKNELISHHFKKHSPTARCIFEHVYFARPDSTLDGQNIFLARERAGRILAMESRVNADVVLGVPDSGTPAAIGFSAESGILYSAAIIKNKYIGRTYTQQKGLKREISVRMKLNPIKECIQGKRVVLVDDSIVRGTTMLSIVAIIREAGATQVHLRISSPPVKKSCPFGISTPDQAEMIANRLSKAELIHYLGVDSLEYLSMNGLMQSVQGHITQYCAHCFGGHCPTNGIGEYIEP